MNLTKRRWIILVLCCLINLCIGAVYAWSVFATPMAEFLSEATGKALTIGDLAIVYTVANGVGPITMISGGFFNDRLGPKKVILIGGLMYGIGMILSGFVTSVPALLLTYGLIGGLGIGMVYGCTISTGVKFFPDKRGLVGGITTAVYGLSSVILPPIVRALVGSVGVQMTFRVIGIVFLLVICISSFFLMQCPPDFVPDGWTPPAPAVSIAPTVADQNWKQMLSTPVFYVMIICMLCGALSGMMVISQASGIAQNMMSMTAESAALVVSVLALFNALGRIVAGALSDKLGRINTLTVALVLSLTGLICLFVSGGSIAPFYIGIALVGISFGSFMGVYPGFTADRFGAKNNSVNYGIMFIGFALSGYVGPQIAASVFRADGTYTRAFLFAGCFVALGLVLTFVYRVLAKRSK